MITMDNKQSPYTADIDNVKLMNSIDPKVINNVENGTDDKALALLSKARTIIVGGISVVVVLVWLFSWL